MISEIPSHRYLVRHAETDESAGRQAAYDEGKVMFDCPIRPELTSRGELQARHLGELFRALPEDLQPTAVLCSPARRATKTLQLMFDAAGWDRKRVRVKIDPRLRDRNSGPVMSRYTSVGEFLKAHPKQKQRLYDVGMLEYVPPGGESYLRVFVRVMELMVFVENSFGPEHPNILVLSHGSITKVLAYSFNRLLALENGGSGDLLERQSFDKMPSIAHGALIAYDWNVETKRPRSAGQIIVPHIALEALRR
jgi:broad specificity phosphatase PhoE